MKLYASWLPSDSFMQDMELFCPEEGASWRVTLITEPAVSPMGQIMTIARDRECNMQRLLLESCLEALDSHHYESQLCWAELPRLLNEVIYSNNRGEERFAGC